MRNFDRVVKDGVGMLRVGNVRGKALMRVIDDPAGPILHIRIPANCNQARQRGDCDFYVTLDDFVNEAQRSTE